MFRSSAEYTSRITILINTVKTSLFETRRHVWRSSGRNSSTAFVKKNQASIIAADFSREFRRSRRRRRAPPRSHDARTRVSPRWTYCNGLADYPRARRDPDSSLRLAGTKQATAASRCVPSFLRDARETAFEARQSRPIFFQSAWGNRNVK